MERDRVVVAPARAYFLGGIVCAIAMCLGVIDILHESCDAPGIAFAALWSVGLGNGAVRNLKRSRTALLIVLDSASVEQYAPAERTICAREICAVLLRMHRAVSSDEFDMVEVVLQLRHHDGEPAFVFQAYAGREARAGKLANSLAQRWRVPLHDATNMKSR